MHAPVQTVTSVYMHFQGRTYNLGLVIGRAAKILSVPVSRLSQELLKTNLAG